MTFTDVRYALRFLVRSPWLSVVAVLSLALGIGANTAIFSIYNTVALRPLAIEHPEQLVELLQHYPDATPRGGYWGWSSYEHFRKNNHVFAAITGTSFDNLALVRIGAGDPERMVLESVPGNYFATLGLTPAIGRLIGPEDVPAKGDGDVVVVSWFLWDAKLNRDPGVVGRRIRVGDAVKTIVGVAPRDWSGPRVGAKTDLWMPHEGDQMALLARLKPGVTLQQAQAEMNVLHQFTIEELVARTNNPVHRQRKVDLEPAAAGMARVRDQYGKALTLLLAAVGVLLLLACINVASMLLARSAGRQRELAVRVSLGASRARLIRLVLTESLLLSGAGALAGVAVAYPATDLLVRIMASGRAHERIELHVVPDWRVLLFTLGLGLLTGLLFGLAPAWQACRMTPATSLRQSGRATDTRFRARFGNALVMAQVALSVVLLTGGIVFITHMERLRHLDLGFRSDHVLLVSLDPGGSGFKRAQLAAPYRELLTRFRALPGVQSVAIAACTPIQGCGASRYVGVDGFAERQEDRKFTALSSVSPGYLETLGIPLLAGRDFQFSDASRSRVAILSEAMARYYFAGQNPIGRHVRIVRDPRTGGWYGGDEPYEVIGVAGDAKATELREPAPRTMYLNMFQEDQIAHQFALRVSGTPTILAGPVREIVKEVLKPVRIGNVTTLAAQVDAAIVPERLIATLSGFFAALGALLVAIGLYGLLAWTVVRRTNEIGVRMALGATPGAVSRLIVREALVMVAAGMASGIWLVLWSRPVASSLVEGLQFSGAASLAEAGAALLAVAVLASMIPVRRAVRVDPAVALRHE